MTFPYNLILVFWTIVAVGVTLFAASEAYSYLRNALQNFERR